MKIDKFLEKLRDRLVRTEKESGSGALIFFDCLFKESFGRAIDVISGIPQSWRELNFETKNDWKGIYNIATDVLWDAACSSSSEVHPDTFKEATAVSIAFSQEVKEFLGIEFEPLVVLSPTDMMVGAGLLEVKEEDGKRYVRLSEKGKEIAEEVEEEINRITK